MASTAGADRRRQGYDVSNGQPPKEFDELDIGGDARSYPRRVERKAPRGRVLASWSLFVLTDSRLQFLRVAVSLNTHASSTLGVSNGVRKKEKGKE